MVDIALQLFGHRVQPPGGVLADSHQPVGLLGNRQPFVIDPGADADQGGVQPGLFGAQILGHPR